MAASLDYEVHHYAQDRNLQQLGVWPVDLDDKSKYWVIYIHGGAWIDPNTLHKTFTPSIDNLISSSSSSSPASSSSPVAKPLDRIAAFASLDYRLTADPVNRPQDPATTPASQLRDAAHPDHVRDVASGIAYLQDKYGFGSRYVLLGHSAGATLVFQVIADLTTTSAAKQDDEDVGGEGEGGGRRGKGIVHPEAAVGLCGIYDLNALWDRTGGDYSFIQSVFGPDRGTWDAASPACFPADTKKKYSGIWQTSSKGTTNNNRKKKPIVILALSQEDELIAQEDVRSMDAALSDDAGLEYALVADLRGKHDEVWEDGGEVARMITLALDKLSAS